MVHPDRKRPAAKREQGIKALLNNSQKVIIGYGITIPVAEAVSPATVAKMIGL